MPTVTEIRARSLLTAAEQAIAIATSNLAVANPPADAALAAIDAAVKAARYDSWKIESGVVKVPTRLRGWSAQAGILPTAYVSIGLDDLVSALATAQALQTKRQSEHAGLVYVIATANGILLQDTDYAAETTAGDLNALLAMLADITASMAE